MPLWQSEKKSSYYLQAESENINLKLRFTLLNWNSSFLSANWTDSSMSFTHSHIMLSRMALVRGMRVRGVRTPLGPMLVSRHISTGPVREQMASSGYPDAWPSHEKIQRYTKQIGNAMKPWSPNQWTIYIYIYIVSVDVKLHILKHILIGWCYTVWIISYFSYFVWSHISKYSL